MLVMFFILVYIKIFMSLLLFFIIVFFFAFVLQRYDVFLFLQNFSEKISDIFFFYSLS